LLQVLLKHPKLLKNLKAQLSRLLQVLNRLQVLLRSVFLLLNRKRELLQNK